VDLRGALGPEPPIYPMSEQLLKRFIRMAVMEAHLARVPNQLVSTSGHEGEDEAEQGDSVQEFSGVGGGGLQGFSGPLGAGSNARKGGKKRKQKS
jgi:hypothetical protein